MHFMKRDQLPCTLGANLRLECSRWVIYPAMDYATVSSTAVAPKRLLLIYDSYAGGGISLFEFVSN